MLRRQFLADSGTLIITPDGALTKNASRV